ncbi:MAG: CUB domain-containing protein [Bacteroidia bacterium]|nr:CUB domain-containing protein [Bacteroidia bacterium]
MKTNSILFFGILTILLYGLPFLNYAQTNEIIIGNGTNLSKQFPINRQFNYTKCELIYTSQEIGQAGWIKEIDFFKGIDDASGDINNVKVSFKYTNENELYNGIWDSTGYSEVFSGTIINSTEPGWKTLILAEPFLYNGQENLAITIDHGFQALANIVPKWQYTVLSNGTTRCRVGQSNLILPDSLYTRVGRPNIRIIKDPIKTETDFLTIGTGTQQSKLFPINRQSNYSRWEGLYTKNEIGHEGVIYTVSFYKANTLSDGDILNVKVYIKHTNQSEINTGDWSETGYTEVFNGTLPDNSTSGWKTITLTQPFKYNGNNNLAITVDHGYQLFTNNYPEWQYTKTAGKMSRAADKDNQMPVRLMEKTGRPNLKLEIGCKLPIAHAGNDKVVCEGYSVILGDQIAATGGFPPYSYNWFPTDFLNSSTIEHPTATPLKSLFYELVVSDYFGCKSIPDKIEVKVNKPTDEYSFRKDATVLACQGRFYDSGGKKEYQYNEDYTVTFYPCDVFNKVTFNFIEFDLEYEKSCDDFLKIYDGPNTSSPLIGSYCGRNNPGYVNSTNPDGAITFVFHSDNEITGKGWMADIKCVKKTCTELAGTPVITFSGDQCTSGEATISLINNIGTFNKWEFSYNNIDFKDLPDGTMYPYHSYLKTTTYFRALVKNSVDECYTSSVGFHTGRKYYVNDRDTKDDIYCTTVGNDQMDGLSPKTPKESVQSILDSYDVSACDTIYVDAGLYERAINITASDYGSSEANIEIIGATQETTIFSAKYPDQVTFKDASYVKISVMTFRGNGNTNNNINIFNSSHNCISSCLVSNAKKSNVNIVGEKLFSSNNLINNNSINSEIENSSALKFIGNARNNNVSGNIINQQRSRNIPAISIYTKPGSHINNLKINNNIINSFDIGISIKSEGMIGLISNISVSENTINIEMSENADGGCLFAESVSDSLKVFSNQFNGGFAGIQFRNQIEKSEIYNNYISKSRFGIIGSENGVSHKIYFNSFYNYECNIYFPNSPNNKWFVKDNVFYTRSGSCIMVINNPEFGDLDYNLYYTENGSILAYNNNENIYTTLSDWKEEAHQNWPGKDDEHSIYGDPLYLNLGANNLDIEYISIANFAGIPINGFSFDIANHQRKTPPAIGAFDPVFTSFIVNYNVINETFDSPGRITLDIAGGKPPYRILWEEKRYPDNYAAILAEKVPFFNQLGYSLDQINGFIDQMESTPVLYPLISGKYHVTITDSDGSASSLVIPVGTELISNSSANVNYENYSLIKTKDSEWQDGIILFDNIFHSDTSGFIIFNVDSINSEFAIGLLPQNNNISSYLELKYGVHIINNSLNIIINGVETTNIATISSGSKIEIGIEGGNILVLVNNNEVYKFSNITKGYYQGCTLLKSLGASLKQIIFHPIPISLNLGFFMTPHDAACYNSNSINYSLDISFNTFINANVGLKWFLNNNPTPVLTETYFGHNLQRNFPGTSSIIVGSGDEVRLELTYTYMFGGTNTLSRSYTFSNQADWVGVNNLTLSPINRLTKPITQSWGQTSNAYTYNTLNSSTNGKTQFIFKPLLNNELVLFGLNPVSSSNSSFDGYGLVYFKFSSYTSLWYIAENQLYPVTSMSSFSDFENLISIEKLGLNFNCKVNGTSAFSFNATQPIVDLNADFFTISPGSTLKYTSTTFSCPQQHCSYYGLKKESDGNIYKPILLPNPANPGSYLRYLPIKFEEEYTVEPFSSLSCKIYKTSNQQFITSLAPFSTGYNQFKINLSNLSLLEGEYYTLEISNSKGEKWFLRFFNLLSECIICEGM